MSLPPNPHPIEVFRCAQRPGYRAVAGIAVYQRYPGLGASDDDILAQGSIAAVYQHRGYIGDEGPRQLCIALRNHQVIAVQVQVEIVRTDVQNPPHGRLPVVRRTAPEHFPARIAHQQSGLS